MAVRADRSALRARLVPPDRPRPPARGDTFHRFLGSRGNARAFLLHHQHRQQQQQHDEPLGTRTDGGTESEFRLRERNYTPREGGREERMRKSPRYPLGDHRDYAHFERGGFRCPPPPAPPHTSSTHHWIVSVDGARSELAPSYRRASPSWKMYEVVDP